MSDSSWSIPTPRCRCLVKTPEIAFHDVDCEYRINQMRTRGYDVLTTSHVRLDVRNTDVDTSVLKSCFSNIPNSYEPQAVEFSLAYWCNFPEIDQWLRVDVSDANVHGQAFLVPRNMVSNLVSMFSEIQKEIQDDTYVSFSEFLSQRIVRWSSTPVFENEQHSKVDQEFVLNLEYTVETLERALTEFSVFDTDFYFTTIWKNR